MNKKYMIWGVTSVIVYTLLFYFMVHARYLYNDDFLYITIGQYDEMFMGYLYVSFGFMVFLGLLFTLIYCLKKDLLHNRFVFGSLLLPSFPAITGFLMILFELLRKKDSYYYNRLGSRFTIHHLSEFPNPMTMTQFENIGETLSYGAGLFLALLLYILIIVNIWTVYIKYHKKFIKDYY